MQPESSAKLLFDAAEAPRAVTQFVSGRTFEKYSQGLMLRSAVERQLFIWVKPCRSFANSILLPSIGSPMQEGSWVSGTCWPMDMGR